MFIIISQAAQGLSCSVTPIYFSTCFLPYLPFLAGICDMSQSVPARRRRDEPFCSLGAFVCCGKLPFPCRDSHLSETKTSARPTPAGRPALPFSPLHGRSKPRRDGGFSAARGELPKIRLLADLSLFLSAPGHGRRIWTPLLYAGGGKKDPLGDTHVRKRYRAAGAKTRRQLLPAPPPPEI